MGEPSAKKAKMTMPPEHIKKIGINRDRRMLKLNCLYDNGGTEEGCHRDPFPSFKALLKHNLEQHKGGTFPCNFCGMYFLTEMDRFNHTGSKLLYIINYI